VIILNCRKSVPLLHRTLDLRIDETIEVISVFIQCVFGQHGDCRGLDVTCARLRLRWSIGLRTSWRW
jgi:hypothetical protein